MEGISLLELLLLLRFISGLTALAAVDAVRIVGGVLRPLEAVAVVVRSLEEEFIIAMLCGSCRLIIVLEVVPTRRVSALVSVSCNGECD